jgi:hypothetical protein
MSNKPESGDDLVEDDRFVLTFPCFTIMNTNGKGGVVLPQDDGNIACIILTDEDLLQRFREEHGLHGSPLRFEHYGQLFLFLRTLPPSVTLIAFDPGKAAATVYPVERLKRFLRNKIKEEAGEE